MLSALSAVRPGVLLLGASVAIGLYAVHAHEAGHRVAPAPKQVPTITLMPKNTGAPPTLVTSPPSDDELEEETVEEDELEEIRGMTPIEDPAEFAMVFSVDGVSYIRLSSHETASAHGTPEMFVTESSYAVVAPVRASAMPEELRTWAGRTVMVDGTCRAKVVGFAEVSRVAGDPPGTEEYYYSPEEERPDEMPQWTIESVRNADMMLAARLDGCDGTWARGTEFSPAAIAQVDSNPDLESAALADLLAKNDFDPIQDTWKESGGDGDWRDAADPTVVSYTHPLTGEHWIFASAYKAGGCGDPGVEVMAAYRATDGGKVHRVAELDHAGQTLDSVIDVDGDGQPELLFGSGDSLDLVDLENTSHDSISVDFHSWGCGC